MNQSTHPAILSAVQPHSIDAHPLRAMLTPDEFAALSRQVQYCQVSWPVCLEIVRSESREGTGTK
jgi:hypothetical protein